MATLSKGEQRRESARKGQKRAMESRRCPQCGRGNALTRINADSMISCNCRFCDYVRIRSTWK